MRNDKIRCAKCENLVGGRCRLADYQPCDFIPRKEKDIVLYLKIIAIPVILFILLMLLSNCL